MQELVWSITRWIVINKRPFNIVQSPEFAQMFQTANPRIVMPERKRFKRTAEKMLSATMDNVRGYMLPLWSYCAAYTADMWSALDQTQYLGLQLHVYNKDWQYICISTGALLLPPPHNAHRVAQAIDNALLNMGFTG